MVTHSSILAWRIPWTEEPGGLQSMGSQRVRHAHVKNMLLVFKRMGLGMSDPLKAALSTATCGSFYYYYYYFFFFLLFFFLICSEFCHTLK